MNTVQPPWNGSDLHADVELVARVVGADSFGIASDGKIRLAWDDASSTSMTLSPGTEGWVWVVWTARMAAKSSLPDAPAA
jgi:hypothetical protein